MKDNQKITTQTELYEKILKVKLSSHFQTALIWKWLHIMQYFTKVNVSWIQGLFVHPSRFLKYQASPEIWEPPLCYVDGGSTIWLGATVHIQGFSETFVQSSWPLGEQYLL